MVCLGGRRMYKKEETVLFLIKAMGCVEGRRVVEIVGGLGVYFLSRMGKEDGGRGNEVDSGSSNEELVYV